VIIYVFADLIAVEFLIKLNYKKKNECQIYKLPISHECERERMKLIDKTLRIFHMYRIPGGYATEYSKVENN